VRAKKAVTLAVPGKTRRRRLTITNSTDDFMRLIAILRDYDLPVRIGPRDARAKDVKDAVDHAAIINTLHPA
jgi:hypothetical protein